MYNKVEYNGETLIDLTDTTATENDVVQGKQFHDKSGALRNGNLVPQTYTAGAGIDITNNKIAANVDGTTIDTNNDNELEISQELQNTINNKVDKVEGKGLSTNDFTNELKATVEDLEQDVAELGASKQPRFILDGGYGLQYIQNPAGSHAPSILSAYIADETISYNLTEYGNYGAMRVNTDIIATKAFVRAVNDLANYYLKSETYTKTEVNQLIGAIPKFKIEVVNQLPTTDISTATVYLVTTGAESQNLYTEYIYVNNAWEKLGTQTVDLTGYATQTWVSSYIQSAFNSTLSNFYNKQEVDTALGNKVDKITGKGLSTNDFTNEYKSKIETNEYNDIFNIRVEWDRQYMPNAELIAISFQEYENGILVNKVFKDDVKDITNGNVYLYKDIRNLWMIAVGTPPSSSSYHRLPMLVGKIATKTVNGATVKLFFRNGDDETQFDELNSGKVDSDLLVPLTQSAYDNLPSVNPDAYYFIEEE